MIQSYVNFAHVVLLWGLLKIRKCPTLYQQPIIKYWSLKATVVIDVQNFPESVCVSALEPHKEMGIPLFIVNKTKKEKTKFMKFLYFWILGVLQGTESLDEVSKNVFPPLYIK